MCIPFSMRWVNFASVSKALGSTPIFHRSSG